MHANTYQLNKLIFSVISSILSTQTMIRFYVAVTKLYLTYLQKDSSQMITQSSMEAEVLKNTVFHREILPT